MIGYISFFGLRNFLKCEVLDLIIIFSYFIIFILNLIFLHYKIILQSHFYPLIYLSFYVLFILSLISPFSILFNYSQSSHSLIYSFFPILLFLPFISFFIVILLFIRSYPFFLYYLLSRVFILSNFLFFQNLYFFDFPFFKHLIPFHFDY